VFMEVVSAFECNVSKAIQFRTSDALRTLYGSKDVRHMLLLIKLSFTYKHLYIISILIIAIIGRFLYRAGAIMHFIYI
jgi:hypothetical protein